MKEHQTIEYKQIWRDDYLKWVCGFANAKGLEKNYMGAHIQIEVHDDRLCFWNDGKLPEDLPIKLLKKNHSSKPRNPIIADVCFKGGYIDAWGRGIKKIMDACKEEGLPEPEFEENSGGIMVTLFAAHSRIKKSATPQVTPQVKKLINALTGEMTRAKLMKAAKLKDRVSFLRNYLEPALKNAFIEMTQPDSPNSPTQKYRSTEKGISYKQRNKNKRYNDRE